MLMVIKRYNFRSVIHQHNFAQLRDICIYIRICILYINLYKYIYKYIYIQIKTVHISRQQSQSFS